MGLPLIHCRLHAAGASPTRSCAAAAATSAPDVRENGEGSVLCDRHNSRQDVRDVGVVGRAPLPEVALDTTGHEGLVLQSVLHVIRRDGLGGLDGRCQLTAGDPANAALVDL